MQKTEIRKKTEEIFTFLYMEGVSSKFRFPMGYSAKSVDEFVDIIYKRENGLVSLGILIDYCIHQVHSWRNSYKDSRFKVSWAFSKKAINKFYDTKSGVRYYQDLWLEENNLNRADIKNRFTSNKEHPLRKFIYIESEDRTKYRLLNKPEGFYQCVALTTLYSPQSPVCTECIFKEKCEAMLKKKSTELHRLRTTNNI